MLSAVNGVSTFESFMQLLGLLLVFILILVACYLTTKWVSKTSLGQNKNSNIKVIETYRVNQTKFIQIIKIGEKYIVVGISKDHMEFLTELQESELTINTDIVQTSPSFKDVLQKLKKQDKGFHKEE